VRGASGSDARWEVDGTIPSLAAPPLTSQPYSLSMAHLRASHAPAKFALAKPGVKPATPAMVPSIAVKNAHRAARCIFLTQPAPKIPQSRRGRTNALSPHVAHRMWHRAVGRVGAAERRSVHPAVNLRGLRMTVTALTLTWLSRLHQRSGDSGQVRPARSDLPYGLKSVGSSHTHLI